MKDDLIEFKEKIDALLLDPKFNCLNVEEKDHLYFILKLLEILKSLDVK